MLSAEQIIAQKRDGGVLSQDQIAAFISGYASSEIPDYQMSALAMAICLNGMDAEETAALTDQMLKSGTVLSWPSGPPVVDKHSTGGIGDKVSLVLAPLLACCGLRVPMISGRGLGATGGTLDKLEAIPGFRTDLSTDEISSLCDSVGCVITGATSDIAPADRKLYALRDVTATVASIPLITASIMSKKLAENLDALVLDVKFGSGAFMKSLAEARKLAQSLVETGRRMGVKTSALLTDMNQPLGRMAGNAVEVNESLEALKGTGPDDLMQLVIALSSEVLLLTGRATSLREAQTAIDDHLTSGRAIEKFHEMVIAQGGDLDMLRTVAPASEVVSNRAGCVLAIDTEALGYVINSLGGGRQKVSDKIDHSVGLEMLVRLGDRVEVGQPLARVFSDSDGASRGANRVRESFTIGDEPLKMSPLIVERISSEQP